ncbi:uncharacterized protein LOC119065566 [Artibeus jamaicensis]|uniref:uncharacterized protein LOC119065566 n=1 Tax=Artibeus jamaicensis TaxID=9417 RepID=UPI00235AA4C2|nr:uncharacterized protein LOC119065566 [Artibeus jamaicensis]
MSGKTISIVILSKKGGVGQLVPILWSGLGRTQWLADLFCLASGRASQSSSPGGPCWILESARSSGRGRGHCVKGLRGWAVRRPARSPGSLPPPPAAPLPAACGRPQHWRAGHVGASVTPSLTLTHTRAALVLCSWPKHRRWLVPPWQLAGQRPFHPPPGAALGRQLLLSSPLLQGLHQSHLDSTRLQQLLLSDASRPEERVRQANVPGTTTAGCVFSRDPNSLLREPSCDKCFYSGPSLLEARGCRRKHSPCVPAHPGIWESGGEGGVTRILKRRYYLQNIGDADPGSVRLYTLNQAFI